MRDLSLHILDLVDNSLRAGAQVIRVVIDADSGQNRLRIIILDDGCGLKVTPQQALDPFYTTKSGKKTGLGLSLFKAACERAGGKLSMASAIPSGLGVEATMQLNHLDRSPMGDLGATICSVVCMNPDVDLQIELVRDDKRFEVSSANIAEEMKSRAPESEIDPMALAREVCEKMKAELPRWADRPVMI